MDQKRYQKHLAKKKASHERRTKRVHELDAHPRIYEKPQPIFDVLPPPVENAALAAAIRELDAVVYIDPAHPERAGIDVLHEAAAEAEVRCLCGAPMVGPGQCSAPDCVCNVATSEAPDGD